MLQRLVLLLVICLGIFFSIQGCAVECSSSSECPAGYLCSTSGQCLQHSTNPDGNTDKDNKDNKKDETCKDGETRPCYDESETHTQHYGNCTAGTQTCKGTKWGACENQITPTKEVCDKEDNDCDGYIDEDLKDCECKDYSDCSSTDFTCLGGRCIKICSEDADCEKAFICSKKGECEPCPKDNPNCNKDAGKNDNNNNGSGNNNNNGGVQNGNGNNGNNQSNNPDWNKSVEGYPPAPYGPANGQTFPNLTFTDCEGNKHSALDVFKNKKVKVLYMSLHTGWCGVCKREAAAAKGLQDKYGDKLVIWNVLLEGTRKKSPVTTDYCKQHQSQYKLKLQLTGNKDILYKIGERAAFPNVFIIRASDMKVQYRKAGYSATAVSNYISKLAK